MTIQQWRFLSTDRPGHAGGVLLGTAERAASRGCNSWEDIDDIAQEAAFRFLAAEERRRLDGAVPLAGWLGGTVRNIRRERHRAVIRKASGRADSLRDLEDLEDPSSGGDAGLTCVEVSASLKEAYEECLRVVAILPPPYVQIGRLIRVGARLSEVAGYLRDWRGVGIHEARRLYRRTKEIVRACMWGNPRKRVSDLYDSRKNRWLNTPPPRLGSYRE